MPPDLMHLFLMLALQEADSFDAFGMLVPLLILLLVFYFFIFRPRKKRGG